MEAQPGLPYRLGRHVSPTANHHDAMAAVELALAEAERLAGRPLQELAPRDPDGNIEPLVTIVDDNGGHGGWSLRRSPPPAALRHVRTRVRASDQNVSASAASAL